jgi:hypothetical protein
MCNVPAVVVACAVPIGLVAQQIESATMEKNVVRRECIRFTLRVLFGEQLRSRDETSGGQKILPVARDQKITTHFVAANTECYQCL